MDDGEEFAGETAIEVVLQMKNTMWNAPNHKRDYMEDVVERVENMTGVLSDMHQPMDEGTQESSEHFLMYLQEAGLIRVEKGLPSSG